MTSLARMNRAEFHAASRRLPTSTSSFRAFCARVARLMGTRVRIFSTYAERKGIAVSADLATTRVHNARDKTQIKPAARYSAL